MAGGGAAASPLTKTNAGKRWNTLSIEEKLRFLKFESVHEEDLPEHKKASGDPDLDEQFQLTGYEEIEKDSEKKFFLEEKHHRKPEPLSPSFCGASGMGEVIDAYVLPRGKWRYEAGYHSFDLDRNYFTSIYDDGDGGTLRLGAAYGLRDGLEVWLRLNVTDNTLSYMNGYGFSDSTLLPTLGFKVNVPLSRDYEMGFGATWTPISMSDRDILRMLDYHSLDNVFMTFSTSSRLFDLHLMFKYISYEWDGDTPPSGDHDNDATTGYAPHKAGWVDYGIGLEYEVRKNMKVLLELVKNTDIDFIGRKEARFNLGFETFAGRGATLKGFIRAVNNNELSEFDVNYSVSF